MRTIWVTDVVDEISASAWPDARVTIELTGGNSLVLELSQESAIELMNQIARAVFYENAGKVSEL